MKKELAASPEEIWGEAIEFMVDRGATIATRSDQSVTFSVPALPGLLDMGMILAMPFVDWAAGSTEMSSMRSRALGADRPQTTIVARKKGDGCVVVLPDTENDADKLIRSWFVADILREPLPKPILTLRMGFAEVEVFSDRLERNFVMLGTRFRRRVLKMEDVDTVGRSGRRLIVLGTEDDEMIDIDTKSAKVAEEAREVVQARVDIYHRPSLLKEAP
jgi:hypothetical protein